MNERMLVTRGSGFDGGASHLATVTLGIEDSRYRTADWKGMEPWFRVSMTGNRLSFCRLRQILLVVCPAWKKLKSLNSQSRETIPGGKVNLMAVPGLEQGLEDGTKEGMEEAM